MSSAVFRLPSHSWSLWVPRPWRLSWWESSIYSRAGLWQSQWIGFKPAPSPRYIASDIYGFHKQSFWLFLVDGVGVGRQRRSVGLRWRSITYYCLSGSQCNCSEAWWWCSQNLVLGRTAQLMLYGRRLCIGEAEQLFFSLKGRLKGNVLLSTANVWRDAERVEAGSAQEHSRDERQWTELQHGKVIYFKDVTF